MITTVNCNFIFRRTYSLGHAFHAILNLVWESLAKTWHFWPLTWHPTDLRSLNHMFSIPIHLRSSAVYLETGKFGWNPFSSRGKNRPWRTSAAHSSDGGYKLVNVSQAWLGRFLCGFHHLVQNLSGQNQTTLLVSNIPLFDRYAGCIVGQSTPTVTCLLLNLIPNRFQKPYIFYSSPSAVRVEFGWDPFTDLGEIVGKNIFGNNKKSSCSAMRERSTNQYLYSSPDLVYI